MNISYFYKSKLIFMYILNKNTMIKTTYSDWVNSPKSFSHAILVFFIFSSVYSSL